MNDYLEGILLKTTVACSEKLLGNYVHESYEKRW
jgi:hypothetical protein